VKLIVFSWVFLKEQAHKIKPTNIKEETNENKYPNGTNTHFEFVS